MQITFTKHFSLASYCLPIMGLLLLLSNSVVHAAEKPMLYSYSTTEMGAQIQKSIADIEVIQKTLDALLMDVDKGNESTELNNSRVQAIADRLDLIDNELKKAYSALGESQAGIASNTKAISVLTEDLVTKAQEIRTIVADLVSQKSLIEDNSIRLYEILIKISGIGEQIEKFAEALEGIQNTSYISEIKVEVTSDINGLWRLLAIVLTFFAPLAFVLSSNRKQYQPLIDGIAQHQGALLVCLVVFLGYFGLGFGLMYGASASGWIGTSSYLMGGQTVESSLQPNFPFTEFVLYQTGFAMLAAMIVYIAVGQQLSSAWHLILALFVGAVLIPIFGHWVWAGYFVSDNKGWLEGLGFIDQSGSIVINAVAAWFAFFMVLKLGRSAPPPKLADEKFDNPVYSTSAVLLLWLSWLGLTAGTLPISNEQISSVMLNVGLAGSAGGLAAYFHHTVFYSDKSQIAHGLGGFVAGLVAIAACAQSVTYVEAVVIGVSAGLLQNFAYSFLRKFFLKQDWQIRAAYLVAIHGVGGIWGALCVALLSTDGSFGAPNFVQLITQLKGIAAALVYSFVMASIMMFLLKFRKKRPQATLS